MQIGIKIDDTAGVLTLEQRIQQTRAARDAGFASIWSSMNGDWDGLTALAIAGRETPVIRFGTAIASIYPRHPLVLASQAIAIQEATGNRFTLGVGPGASFFVEHNYGYSAARPAHHMAEYLSALAPLLYGEAVDFHGETLSAAGSVFIPAGVDPPRLLVSALGPVMLDLTGNLADGTITYLAGPRTLASLVVPRITRSAQTAGKPAPDIVATILFSLTNDAEATRAWIAETNGFFGQIPSYRALLDREGAAGVEDVAVVGDEATIQREVQRYQDAGVTEIVAAMFGPPADRSRTHELLAALANEMNRPPVSIGQATD